LPPEVSIITVYYNSPEEILALHQSMQKHLPPGQWEWIVADNNSREDLSERLQEADYLRFPENYGFAKANNKAAEKASAPYLFFVNPDCVLVENCLPPLMQGIDQAAIAGPRVINEDGSVQLSFGPFLSIHGEFLQRKRMKNEKTEGIQSWIRRKGQFSPDYVSGCALLIRKKLYDEIGGFDEDFFLYEEDVDLCKRVHDLGLRILYVPSGTILHRRNSSVRQESERASQEYRKSQRHYYSKHHGWFQNALLKLYLRLR
jgi:GT2 family glycosyltransferase